MKNRNSSLKKYLDRYVGISLLFLFSLFRRKRNFPEKLTKIALMKTAALGDTTLLSAIVNDLGKALPDVEIIMITGPSNDILVPFIRGVDHHISLTLKNPMADIKRIRALKADLLLDFGAWPRINAIYALFSGSRFTAGFRTPGQFRHFAFDRAVPHDNAVHEIQNYRNLASVTGIESVSLPALSVTDNLPKEIINKKYVVFHLAASGTLHTAREWPVHYWKSLAEKITAHKSHVYLTGAKADLPLNRELCKDCSRTENIAGKFSFGETLSILAKAKLVVSVNTGIMHIAAALGVPVIGLSGPTSEQRWGPLGKHSISVTPAVEGCGFLNLGFEYKGQRKDCMQWIDEDTVYQHCKNILDAIG